MGSTHNIERIHFIQLYSVILTYAELTIMDSEVMLAQGQVSIGPINGKLRAMANCRPRQDRSRDDYTGSFLTVN